MKKRIMSLVLCFSLLCSSTVYATEADTGFSSDETTGTVLEAPSETVEEIEKNDEEVGPAFPELDDEEISNETVEKEPTEAAPEENTEVESTEVTTEVESTEVTTEVESTEVNTEVESTEVSSVVKVKPDVDFADLPEYATTNSLCEDFVVDDYPWLQCGYRIIWVDDIPFYVAVSESFDSILERIITSVREYPDSTWAIMKCDADLDVDTVSTAAEIFEVDDVFILRYDSKKEAKKDTKKLDRSKDVEFAELDTEMQVETEVIEPVAEATLTSGYNPEAPVVAILDTGISLVDESLTGKIIDNGIDLTGQDTLLDKHGHGTLMAQIINNKSNGNVRIMPVKVANDKGEATILSTFLGIKYATKHGADIINISMVTVDSEKSKCLEYAISDVGKTQVVVSAGNQGSDVSKFSPANVESAIVVSAVNKDGTFAEYSNYGDTVNISACGDYNGNRGTSVATAVVSGLLCNNTYEELVTTGQDLGDEGWDKYYGDATVDFASDKVVDDKYPSHLNGFVLGDSNLYVQGAGYHYDTSNGRNYFFLKATDLTNGKNVTQKVYITPVGDAWSSDSFGSNIAQYYHSGDNIFNIGVSARSSIQDGWAGIYPYRYFVVPIDITIRSVSGNTDFIITSTNLEGDLSDENRADATTIKSSTSTVTVNLDTNNIGLSNLGADGQFHNGTLAIAVQHTKFTMTVKPNGGSWNGSSSDKNCEVTYGSQSYNNLGVPTRSGYNFTGWYNGSSQIYGADGKANQNSYWMGEDRTFCGHSDFTVVAGWSPYQHTVAYNANGGSGAPGNQTKTYGSTLTLSSTKPTRTGYTFAGWNTASNGTGTGYAAGANYGHDQNGGTVTLYAQWNKKQYTVTCKDHHADGTVTERTKSINHGTDVAGYSTFGTSCNTGEKYDYDDGWHNVTGNTTINVYYKYKTYTMTSYHKLRDVDEKTWVHFATTTQTATYSSTYTPPYSNTPTGYYNYTRDYNSGWKVSGEGSFNVYYWPNSYKCYFNGNNGTVSGTSPVTFTYNSNANSVGSAPTASRTGFTFLGWWSSSADSDDTNDTANGTQIFDAAGNWYNKETNKASWNGWSPDNKWRNGSRTAKWVHTSDTTVYAQWKRNKYTVTYNCTENGGSTANFTASVYYDYDIDFSKTATKTGDTGAYSSSNPDGWQFVGWNTDKNATTGMTSMKMPAKNVTLYAIYKKTITAKFKQYEYTGTDTCANVSSVTNTSKSKTVYNKTTTAELKENTRKSITGWTCDGWTTGTAQNSGITTNFTISKDTQYYMRYSRYVKANFISERTTVSLGGTRYRNSANINSSSPIALTTPAMKSKTGWTQVGWTTSKKANAAASVKQKIAYSLYDNISFYGVYTKGVTVSYDANGGESTPASGTKTAYYNTAGNVLYPSFVTASPIHKNAVAFKNWNTEANGSGTAFASDTSAVFQDSQKLYATFDNIGVTGVVLDTTNLSLLVGESKKITATVQPATATHENMIYESEDTDVATVDTTGNVTGVSTGVTNVVVSSTDNPSVSAKCPVVVSSGSVSVPEKLVLGSRGKITLKNNSTSGTKSNLYLASLSNLVGVESGKEYSLVFDVLNGTEAETKAVDDVVVSTTSTDSILFTVHPNVALSSLLPDKYNATIRYKLVIER